MRRPGWPLAACLVLVSSSSAVAHDTWLAPPEAEVPAGAAVRLQLTSGMRFPALESAIRPERLKRAGLRVAGRAGTLVSRPGRNALDLTAIPAGRGVAVAWVELHPRGLELAPAQVTEYLEEIGEAERIGPRWAQRPGPKRWRETYRKQAKAVFRVGTPEAGDESWREPVGLALEIVPESDPGTLAAAGVLAVRVLKEGEPFPDFALAAVRAAGKRTLRRTDAEGRVSFVLDRSGPWLLAGTDLRPAKDGGWESDFTTLTLIVPDGSPAPVSRR